MLIFPIAADDATEEGDTEEGEEENTPGRQLSLAHSPGSRVEADSLKREVIDGVVVSQQDDAQDRIKLFVLEVGVRQ